MINRPNPNRLICWLAGFIVSVNSGLFTKAMAQSDQPLLLAGVSPGVGIGFYNGIGVSGGLLLRYQHPLRNRLALTAKTGMEGFRYKGRYVEQIQKEYNTVLGFGLPLTVGPRYYFMKGMYGGVDLGIDISLSKLAATSFRFEPGVGVMLPLKAGGYLDVGTSVATSFNKGSGAFLFNMAYGLSRSRLR